MRGEKLYAYALEVTGVTDSGVTVAAIRSG
jgi:hypothetical protein